MNPQTKTGLGAPLAVLGGIGIIVGPYLGATALGRPWSFLVGFALGVVTGIGTALCVAGLLEIRRSRQ